MAAAATPSQPSDADEVATAFCGRIAYKSFKMKRRACGVGPKKAGRRLPIYAAEWRTSAMPIAKRLLSRLPKSYRTSSKYSASDGTVATTHETLPRASPASIEPAPSSSGVDEEPTFESPLSNCAEISSVITSPDDDLRRLYDWDSVGSPVGIVGSPFTPSAPLTTPSKGSDEDDLRLLYDMEWRSEQPEETPMSSDDDPDVLLEAAKWPAHRAAFENDAQALEELTCAWGVEDWVGTLDCCGNTVLHVAALRSSRRCALVALRGGCPVDCRNRAGWTPFEELASCPFYFTSRERPRREMARLLFDWQEVHSAVADNGNGDEEEEDAPQSADNGAAPSSPGVHDSTRALTSNALQAMPDFELEVRWRFGSPLFGLLVRRYAPSDVYHIWKVGDRLRVDMTLVGASADESDGGDNPPKAIMWKRGKISLLLGPHGVADTQQTSDNAIPTAEVAPTAPAAQAADAAPTPPTLVLLNHKTRCAYFPTEDGPAQPIKRTPRISLRLTVGADGSIGTTCDSPTQRSRATASSIGGTRDVSVDVPRLPPLPFFAHSDVFVRAALAELGEALVDLDTAGEGGNAAKDAASDDWLPEMPAAAEAYVPVVSARLQVGETAADRRFATRFSDKMYPMSTKMKTVDAALRPVLDWVGNQQAERIGGVQTRVWEASTRLRYDERSKVNSFHVTLTFAAYVAGAEIAVLQNTRSAPVVLPVNTDGALKAVGLRKQQQEESGSVLRARLWLAPQFPLNAQHFSLLLGIIAVASKKVARAQAAIRRWQMRDAFPMKLHLPLFLTVWASVTCSGYKPLSEADLPASSWFDVPGEYERRESKLENVAAELGLKPSPADMGGGGII